MTELLARGSKTSARVDRHEDDSQWQMKASSDSLAGRLKCYLGNLRHSRPNLGTSQDCSLSLFGCHGDWDSGCSSCTGSASSVGSSPASIAGRLGSSRGALLQIRRLTRAVLPLCRNAPVVRPSICRGWAVAASCAREETIPPDGNVDPLPLMPAPKFMHAGENCSRRRHCGSRFV